MFDFDPLWKTLSEKNMSTYRLIKEYGFSKGTLNNMKHNRNVNMTTIDTLCQILQTPVEGVVHVTLEEMHDRSSFYQTRMIKEHAEQDTESGGSGKEEEDNQEA